MRIKITKTKMIAAALILCALTAAWFYDDGHTGKNTVPQQTATMATDPVKNTAVSGATATAKTESPTTATATEKTTPADGHTKAEQMPSAGQTQSQASAKKEDLTDPQASQKPEPIDPQQAEITDTAYTCTLSVTCKIILDHMDSFDKKKLEALPQDGIIFPATKVTFYEGESVFNVLQREMKKAGIQMEFQSTPLYNSAYIEGIHNIYEFDCGALSGWMYAVNGWFPNYGCSRYQLQDVDVVKWVYTCDLGRDVGGDYAANTDGGS